MTGPAVDQRADQIAYDPRMMRRLLAYLRPHLGAVAIAFVAIVGSSIVDLAQPWITQRAIDGAITTGDAAGLGRLAALLFVLLLAGFGCEYVQTYVLQTTGQRIMHTIRMQVYGHLQRLDLRF